MTKVVDEMSEDAVRIFTKYVAATPVGSVWDDEAEHVLALCKRFRDMKSEHAKMLEDAERDDG